MFSKRSLPILLMVLFCGVFIAFRTLGTSSNPPSKYERILKSVGDMLTQIHYSPKEINDKFSREIFTKYLESDAVDRNKTILLQSDVDALKKYETKIDDEILGAPVQFLPAVAEILKVRIPESEKIFTQFLAQPFDFTSEETVVVDPKKITYAKTEADRKEAWRKILKYQVLEKYVDLLDVQEKSKGKEGFVVKSNADMEKEARAKVLRSYNLLYERLKFKVNEDDRFNDFVNVITSTMDPHTTFFPPVDKKYFDEQLSHKFFGIGATLHSEDGAITIGTLVTGSPAWKSGQIGIGDVIMKVAQGTQEPVDLTGYETDDAVKLIRGQKGTEVRLTLKKVDGTQKVVSLVRDEIVIDETLAHSMIVDNGKGKIGYINLPEFYTDFENPKGAHSAVDVRKEVIKLRAEKVDGIIMDLRGNPGGGLYDVIDIAGLFIEDGPVVQVKDRDGKATVLKDRDRTILYDGPLAVMVNEFSASASEIFAAAIQDYKRGIIIGSTSTYGKGTVQRSFGLDQGRNFVSSENDLGAIKLTMQKYYRVDGGSVQLKGVKSDVVLPDLYEHVKFREKDVPDALPWDVIQKADYAMWKPAYDPKEVIAKSNSRVANSVAFKTIKTNTDWLEKQNDKVYSLNLDKYRQERKAITASYKQMDSLSVIKPINVKALAGEETRFANDKSKSDRRAAEMKSLSKDIYLNEAVNVVDDMIAATKPAAPMAVK